jgi:glycosyltransferase involved in cell wall biosynthesis
MRRLIFITQTFDPAATILGVTREWVAALAARCGGVDVIALSAGGGHTAATLPNVRVWPLGKERGRGKAGQLAALYAALVRTLPGARAVFVHMVPRYALLAAPLAVAARRPMALWYAQGGVDRGLRAATRLVRWVLTPTRDSFPLSGPGVDPKVAVTGHGIDTARYAPGGMPAVPRRLLAAGRLSPSKRYDALLEAVALLDDRSCHVRIAGGPLYPSDRAYEAGLRAQAERLGIAARVEFAGMLPYEQLPDEYRAAWALAHVSATGSLDKVVLEAMACGTPPVSTAPSSKQALGALAPDLWCADDDPAAFAAHLDGILAWSESRRAAAGRAAREQVEQHHSLPRWADQVVRLTGAA